MTLSNSQTLKNINMKLFRELLIETEHPAGYKNGEYEPSFVGAKLTNGKKGFFNYTYGKGESIRGGLKPVVDMAEDTQAIYEFVQNAEDCNSTEFHIFYNEKYFLAINNGNPFTTDDVKGILNAGQGTKPDDTSKIGEYGIGFKLIHKLIGKGDGIDEMILENKGPIVFSWKEREQLERLFEMEQINNSESFGSSWLFKILLTCFPAGLNEEIINSNGESIIGFGLDELETFRHFLRQNEATIGDLSSFGSGSIFFLEFGEGKSNVIAKHEQEQINYLEASMGRMSHLKMMSINGVQVEASNDLYWNKPIALELENLLARTEKKVIPEIRFAWAPWGSDYNISHFPTFYKYFACSQEKQTSRFLIDSNAFAISPDRTRLDEGERNKSILTLGTKKFLVRVNEIKNENPKSYLHLFANMIATSKSQKPWQNESFVDQIHEYAKNNIPTLECNTRPCHQVVIKDTSLPICLSDVGIDKSWFYWHDDEELLKFARKGSNKSPLQLESYSLLDILKHCDIKKFNDWVCTLTEEQFYIYLEELNVVMEKSDFSDDLRDSLSIFRVNGIHYSINALTASPELLNTVYYEGNNWKEANKRMSRNRIERIILKRHLKNPNIAGSTVFYSVLSAFKNSEIINELLCSVDEIPIYNSDNHISLTALVALAQSMEHLPIEQLQNKFRLYQVSGISCKLNETCVPNEIRLFPDTEAYTIPLSSILPESSLSAFVALKDNIKVKLCHLGLSNELAAKLLEFDGDLKNAKSLKVVQETLSAEINDGILKTAGQLAFVLLYSKYSSSRVNLDNYKVYSQDGNLTDLTEVRYIHSRKNEKLCQPAFVLSSLYKGLKSYLKLDEKNELLDLEDFKIATQPTLDEENKEFVFDGVKLTEPHEKCNVLNSLLSLWISKNDNQLFKNYNHVGLESFIEELKENVLDSSLASSDELAPDFLTQFINNKSSEAVGARFVNGFLKALKIIDANSIEYRLRNSLIKNTAFDEDLEEISREFIERTFEWAKEMGLKFENEIQIDTILALKEDISMELQKVIQPECLEQATEIQDENFESIDDLELFQVEGFVVVETQYEGHTLFTEEFNYYRDEDEVLISDQVDLSEQKQVLELLSDCDVSHSIQVSVMKAMLDNKPEITLGSDREKAPFSSGLTSEEMAQINEEARLAAKKYLSHAFNFDDSVNCCSVVDGVKDIETGKVVPMVIKSLKSCSTLNLNPSEVIQLQKEGAKLIVYKGEDQFVNLSFQEVAEADSLFHIQFRVDQFNSDSLGQFADFFRYMKDVKFQFDSPLVNDLNLNKEFLPNHGKQAAAGDLDEFLQAV